MKLSSIIGTLIVATALTACGGTGVGASGYLLVQDGQYLGLDGPALVVDGGNRSMKSVCGQLDAGLATGKEVKVLHPDGWQPQRVTDCKARRLGPHLQVMIDLGGLKIPSDTLAVRMTDTVSGTTALQRIDEDRYEPLSAAQVKRLKATLSVHVWSKAARAIRTAEFAPSSAERFKANFGNGATHLVTVTLPDAQGCQVPDTCDLVATASIDKDGNVVDLFHVAQPSDPPEPGVQMMDGSKPLAPHAMGGATSIILGLSGRAGVILRLGALGYEHVVLKEWTGAAWTQHDLHKVVTD